jgi:hypothetical protein
MQADFPIAGFWSPGPDNHRPAADVNNEKRQREFAIDELDAEISRQLPDERITAPPRSVAAPSQTICVMSRTAPANSGARRRMRADAIPGRQRLAANFATVAAPERFVVGKSKATKISRLAGSRSRRRRPQPVLGEFSESLLSAGRRTPIGSPQANARFE